MTRRFATLVLLIGFVATACTPAEDRWWKPGFSEDAFARDDAQCRQMTSVPSSRAKADPDAYAICLEAYEYQKIPKDAVPAK